LGTTFIKLIILPTFNQSPSIALEFFQPFSYIQIKYHNQLKIIRTSFQILLAASESQFKKFENQKKQRNAISKIVKYEGDDAEPDNFYIEKFNYQSYTYSQTKKEQISFFELSTELRRNPYNLISLICLGQYYFKGYGMKRNLLKAELIFRRLHFKKKDEGTLWLLKYMIIKRNHSKISMIFVMKEQIHTMD
jgi:hypothetical protein